MKSLLAICFCLFTSSALAVEPLVYQGEDGVGVGKHIVFIANDHEYRSEQSCPLMAKILAKHHGFRCTVLFGIDQDGFIKAGDAPIPGLEALEDADLLVFFTRFMNLPDEQVDQLVNYFESGRPVVGIRTSTHCFNKQAGKWAKLNYNYNGEDYRGGLGEQIFGNTWNKVRGQSHYGSNHQMGSEIRPDKAAGNHPILAGVKRIHTYSGGYKSQPPAGAKPLLELQVLNTFHPSSDYNAEKPLVCAGWTRDSYIAPSGKRKEARVVYTSLGASEDLLSKDARRFLLNASFWALGLEAKITADLNVDIIGEYNPSPYSSGAFYYQGIKPSDLADFESPIMTTSAKLGGLRDQKLARKVAKALQVRPELKRQLANEFSGLGDGAGDN